MGQGGAEKIVYQLCRDNREQQQFVISCGGSYVEELEKIGVKHYTMPDIDKKKPWVILQCFWTIFRVVKKEQIDIIHSHHRMAAFYAQIIRKLCGVKCVYTAHNVFYNKKKLMQYALQSGSIIAVGNGVKQNLTEFYEIPEERICVIRNSIKVETAGTTNALLEEKKQHGKHLIGSIGRLTEQKGMDIFIQALADVMKSFPDVVGVIIGDGEDRASLEQLVKQLSLSEHVLFLGYQKSVLDLIGQLEFVVLSSRWEGLPLTPIEVFSQGKTMIASDIAGNNEIISDKKNGMLFEKDNAMELAAKIKELLGNVNMRQELQKAAQKEYEEKYKYNRFINSYNSVYERQMADMQ
jgi:glycosyltransferase involved in cell wall biosynthesis